MTTLSPHSSHLMKSRSRASSDKTCKTFMILGITYESSQSKEKQGFQGAKKELCLPTVLCPVTGFSKN